MQAAEKRCQAVNVEVTAGGGDAAGADLVAVAVGVRA